MAANFFRAYVPTVEFKSTILYQQSLGTVQTNPLASTPVTVGLVHRKVWVIVESTSGGVTRNWDLVATLNSREVFRMAMVRSLGATLLWYAGYNAGSAAVGSVSEQLFVKIASTTLYAISPNRLNIAADTFYVDPTPGLAGAGSLWDVYLMIQSQAGI